MPYTSLEYCDMHFLYGLCNGNATRARRMYAEKFENRTLPSARTFIETHRRFAEGTLFQNTGRPAPDVDMDEAILRIVNRNRSTSTRNVGYMLGISHSKVHRALKRNELRPYHYTTVQDLVEPIDPVQRQLFCRDLMQRDEEDPHFLARIVWTDESQFTRNGIVNFHNDHIWTDANPHAKRTKAFQTRFNVNVWAGIIGNILIGPIFLPDRLNAENYLQFLIDSEPELMDNAPLIAIREGLIYQQDGCPAHFSRIVRNWLDDRYPGNWIGRGGPIPWPARSPDLTPLDFYLWGYMKSLVYAVRIDSREQLIERIRQAGESARENMLGFNTCDAIRKRLRLCYEQNGGHFEHLM